MTQPTSEALSEDEVARWSEGVFDDNDEYWGHIPASATLGIRRLLATYDQATARAAAAERERDLAIAHDRQPYPTADAYEKACAAIEKHRARADAAEERVRELEGQKDGAYRERDRLVSALSFIFPGSHLARHEGDWEDDWRNIVCVHLPTGQATWHVHDSEIDLFSHLETKDDHWDGHTTEEKYLRLEQFSGHAPVATPPNRATKEDG